MPPYDKNFKPEWTHRFSRGQIVFVKAPFSSSSSSSSSSGVVQPKNCKKYWVWEIHYDEEAGSDVSVLLKDGPGENAKDVEWYNEDRLCEWYEPKEEESLIDLA